MVKRINKRKAARRRGSKIIAQPDAVFNCYVSAEKGGLSERGLEG
jgi:hypothetical protein